MGMRKETFVKNVERRVEKFNKMLHEAIEANGSNEFFFGRNLFTADPITESRIISVADRLAESYQFTLVSVDIDGEICHCTWDEFGGSDFSELDEYIYNTKFRLERTLGFSRTKKEKSLAK